MDDAEAVAEVATALREMAIRNFARVINATVKNSSISFLSPVTIDDYGTVTVGTWGGYLVQIMPMIFNDRIVLTPRQSPFCYDHGWCFDKGGAALLAMLVWDPETQGEPAGYKKRATAGIRQPGEKAETPSPGRLRAVELMAMLEVVNAPSEQPVR